MREFDMVVIHCSATPNGRRNTLEDLDKWHRAKGWQRKSAAMRAFNPRLTSIGYHYVIQVDGTIRTGRSENEIGAHAAGYNTRSIGVCLIGTDKFTAAQWESLADLIRRIKEGRKVLVLGHRDLKGVKKSCPGFDVSEWLANGMIPPEHSLLPHG